MLITVPLSSSLAFLLCSSLLLADSLLPFIATIVIKLVSKLIKGDARLSVHVSHIRAELKSADCKEQKWTQKNSKCFQAPVMFVREMLIVHM